MIRIVEDWQAAAHARKGRAGKHDADEQVAEGQFKIWGGVQDILQTCEGQLGKDKQGENWNSKSRQPKRQKIGQTLCGDHTR